MTHASHRDDASCLDDELRAASCELLACADIGSEQCGRQSLHQMPTQQMQAKDEGGNVVDKVGHEANKAADATKKQVDKLSGGVEKVRFLCRSLSQHQRVQRKL